MENAISAEQSLCKNTRDAQAASTVQEFEVPVEESCCVPTPGQSTNALCDQVWGVWQLHAADLRRYLQGRTREQNLTDDILSDVMLKVYKNCERLAEVKDVKGWLTRVAQNALTDHYRKPKSGELPPADLLAAAGDSDLLPEHRMAACLGEMLLLLPEKDRLPLQWADLEGLPQEEVARRLSISLSGAKSRIQRARLKLRQQIEACCQVETNTQGRVADFYPIKKAK